MRPVLILVVVLALLSNNSFQHHLYIYVLAFHHHHHHHHLRSYYVCGIDKRRRILASPGTVTDTIERSAASSSSSHHDEIDNHPNTMHDILSSMGLTTPKNSKTKTKTKRKDRKKKKSNSINNKNKSNNKVTNRQKLSPSSSSSILLQQQQQVLDIQTQLQYARNGHAVIRNLIEPEVLIKLRQYDIRRIGQDKELEAWRQKVIVATSTTSNSLNLNLNSLTTIQDCKRELAKVGIIPESIPFLQYFNNWRTNKTIQQLTHDLGQYAAQLLDVPTIRLYQDAIFWKRKGDGPTPWHVDGKMIPFDTQHIITFWIPLTEITSSSDNNKNNKNKNSGSGTTTTTSSGSNTGLVFCSKSHTDFALPYWNSGNNGASEWDRLEYRYPPKLVDYMPMDIGDVTVHSGWTLHGSNGNINSNINNNNKDTSSITGTISDSNSNNNNDRIALAITYVDGKAEIRPNAIESCDDEDYDSYKDWIHDVPIRQSFYHHPLIPIVYDDDD